MPLCALQSLLSRTSEHATAHVMDANLAPASAELAQQADVGSGKTSLDYDVISAMNVTIERANRTIYDVISSLNATIENATNRNITTPTTSPPEVSMLQWLLGDIQLVKAVFLVVVISIVLLSTGRLVFKTFSGVGVGKNDCV